MVVISMLTDWLLTGRMSDLRQEGQSGQQVLSPSMPSIFWCLCCSTRCVSLYCSGQHSRFRGGMRTSCTTRLCVCLSQRRLFKVPSRARESNIE